MPISSDVFILSQRELQEREDAAFRRGVERGKFEERAAMNKEPVAKNCKHWTDGYCDHCGAQSQSCQVSWDYKCPHFVQR